jgi:hypothetical protein
VSETTLNEFFGISVKGFWDDILDKLGEAESLAALRTRVIGQLTEDHWPGVLSGMADKAKDLFDIDVGWLLVTGWSKYREVKEYADPKKYAPNESKLLPLGKHTLKVAYSPYLEVLYNGQPFGKLAFDVTLAFQLDSFVLTLQNGKITKVHTGSCEGEGKIEFKGYTLVEKALAKISLPGTIDLGDGITLHPGDDG